MIYKSYQYIEMREGIGKPAQQILTNTEKMEELNRDEKYSLLLWLQMLPVLFFKICKRGL
jgi:hypothetical protein